MTQKGTPYYFAPEMINKNYDEKVDVWAVGIMLYELLTNRKFPIQADVTGTLDDYLKSLYTAPFNPWPSTISD